MEALTATTRDRLSRLAAEGRLTTKVERARLALLALSYGAGLLAAQGTARVEVEAVGRLLLDAALVHAAPDG